MREHPLVLVTGSTDGIGRETARELTRRGARVIVHGRSAARIDETVRELAGLAGQPVPAPVQGDLASLASVKTLAAGLVARAQAGEVLDVVVHNAGVFMNERALTTDGYEATFAVNHLAPFALTHLVVPTMRAGGRLVFVSSIAHTRGHLDLAATPTGGDFSPYGAYAASKLCNVLTAVELGRRLAARQITANALHPGVVSTKLLTEGFGSRGPDSLGEGAATSVHLALSPEVEGTTGHYFVSRRDTPLGRAARDPALAMALYDFSVQATGVAPL